MMSHTEENGEHVLGVKAIGLFLQKDSKGALISTKYLGHYLRYGVSLAFLDQSSTPQVFPQNFLMFWLVQVVAGTDKHHFETPRLGKAKLAKN